MAKRRNKKPEDNEEVPESLLYPPKDDIYNRAEKEPLDPEDDPPLETRAKEKEGRNEKDFDEDQSGADLDVPGAELDDDNEAIGEEDEENNYYSLGGDNHED